MARRPEGNHGAYTRSGLLTYKKETGLNINNNKREPLIISHCRVF